jgi:hypothetical protein
VHCPDALFFFGDPGVKTDIQLLVNLQKIDVKIGELQKNIDAIPREIEDLMRGLLKAKEELQGLLDEIEQEDRERRDAERAVEEERERLVKSKSKIPEVKTNKEYSALLAEIENIEQAISSKEDEILNLMELIEEKNRQKADKELAVKKEEDLFNKMKEEKERQLARLNSELEDETAQRARLTADIEDPLLEQYERLRITKNGIAVVNVEEHACQGCHMTLPPQVVAEIRIGEKVVLCDHCSRMLFITP